MLKYLSQHRFLALVIGIFLLITLAATISFFIPLVSEVCSKNEYTNAKECTNHHIAIAVFWYIVAATNNYGSAITALATIAVAGFTGTLWWAADGQYDLLEKQINLARQQVAIQRTQTDILLKQKEIQQQQFLAEYPPRLRIRHVSVEDAGAIAKQPGLSFSHSAKVTGALVVVNAGGTKATIVESRYRIFCSKNGLPAAAPYDTTFNNLLLVGQILDIGESCAIPLADKIFLTAPPPGIDHVPGQFINQGWSLYVMGQIRYADEGGHERFMGFCRKWGRDGKFTIVDDPDYEYED